MDDYSFAIITQAGNNLGMGNLERCFVLAETIDKEVYFITSESSIVYSESNKNGYKTINFQNKPIESSNKYEDSFMKLIYEYNIKIIIFDLLEEELNNYSFLRKYNDILKVSIAMFPYKEIRFEDFVFYPGFHIPKYNKLDGFNKPAILFSGPEYIIFREEFSTIPKKKINFIAKKILVTMGGSDPNKFTIKVLEALKNVKIDFECTIIIGKDFSFKTKLFNIIPDSSRKYFFLENVHNIAELMFDTDVAIINGGNTRYEMGVVGTPFIALSIHKQQFQITRRMTRHGAGINLGIGNELSITEISTSIESLMKNYKKRYLMSKQMRKLLVLDGAKRIISIIRDYYEKNF